MAMKCGPTMTFYGLGKILFYQELVVLVTVGDILICPMARKSYR
jgi:hypothetical protein